MNLKQNLPFSWILLVYHTIQNLPFSWILLVYHTIQNHLRRLEL